MEPQGQTAGLESKETANKLDETSRYQSLSEPINHFQSNIKSNGRAKALFVRTLSPTHEMWQLIDLKCFVFLLVFSHEEKILKLKEKNDKNFV